MSTDELLAEALRLTRIDRARVAEKLLSSLEESDDEVATAWATELERRSRDVAEGRVQTTSCQTARAEILKELELRRDGRTYPEARIELRSRLVVDGRATTSAE
jgi:putative addiction module component (TIGR02574 family)